MRIINRAGIGKTMLQDVKDMAGSIYSLNAPRAIGYGFDPHKSGKKIARGMFIDRGDDIMEWTYYLDFKTGVIRKTDPGHARRGSKKISRK